MSDIYTSKDIATDIELQLRQAADNKRTQDKYDADRKRNEDIIKKEREKKEQDKKEAEKEFKKTTGSTSIVADEETLEKIPPWIRPLVKYAISLDEYTNHLEQQNMHICNAINENRVFSENLVLFNEKILKTLKH